VLLRRLAAPALAVVLLTGCAAGTEDEVAAPSTPASSAAAPSTPASSAPSAVPSVVASPTPTVRTVTARYAGGQVTGTSGREEVTLGEPVVLRISSDVAEEVHVHGYDITADVPAGASVDVPVAADIPGVFEVELHESGKVLFQLRVA